MLSPKIETRLLYLDHVVEGGRDATCTTSPADAIWRESLRGCESGLSG
jgi:hypothetical protein